MERPAPRETKSAAIARAALSLFAELGVRGATTRAIARRAHTTEGNLYRHYASKEDLARKVIASCLVQFGEEVAHALDGVAGPRQRLAEFARAYFRYARDHPLEHSLILDVHNRQLCGLPEQTLRPRRILVEQARRKQREKHGGSRQKLPLDANLIADNSGDEELLAINDALDRLALQDAQAAELVKLRYFSGLSIEEAAQALGIPRSSAYVQWSFARAALRVLLETDLGNQSS